MTWMRKKPELPHQPVEVRREKHLLFNKLVYWFNLYKISILKHRIILHSHILGRAQRGPILILQYAVYQSGVRSRPQSEKMTPNLKLNIELILNYSSKWSKVHSCS